jgi:hypothetical protein
LPPGAENDTCSRIVVVTIIIVIIIIIIINLNCKWGFSWWQWYYNMTQHTQIHISHKITQHAETRHSTQSYTNNEGHIPHSEYNAKKKKKVRKTWDSEWTVSKILLCDAFENLQA